MTAKKSDMEIAFDSIRTGMMRMFLPNSIEMAIFNDPVTVVIWDDGVKTTVRCQEGGRLRPPHGRAALLREATVRQHGALQRRDRPGRWLRWRRCRMSKEKIKDAYREHSLDDAQARAIATVRDIMKAAALRIDGLCPDGREKSLALTKLEEAAMWANKSIAVGGVGK